MNAHVLLLLSLFASSAAMAQSVVYRSQAAKNCPECKKGEKAITVTQPVGPGDYVHVANPSCPGEFNGKLKQLFRTLANTQIPGIDKYVGPLLDNASHDVAKFLKKNAGGGDLGRIMSPWTEPTAQCAFVSVVLPRKAVITAMTLEGQSPKPAPDKPAGGKCDPSAECPIGWAKWDSYPEDTQAGNARVVHGVFKNWSHNLPRVAKLTVYYKYSGPELR